MTHTQPGPFAGPPPWPAVAPSTLPVVPRQYHEFWRAPAYRWWKGLLAALMGAVTWFFATMVIGMVGIQIDLANGVTTWQDYTDISRLKVTPVFFAANNLSLACSIPVAMLTACACVGQRPGWLSSVTGRIRWRWLLSCFAWVLPPYLVILVISLGFGGEALAWNENSLFMIVVILLTTPLQSAGEEFLLRGLATRIVGSWFPRTAGLVAAALISAVVFMSLHLAQDVWLNAFYLLFALLASLLVWRTGGLEAAVALHVVNNLTSMVTLPFVDFSDMFNRQAGAGDASMLLQFALMAIAGGLVLWRARVAGVVTENAPAALPPGPLPPPPAPGCGDDAHRPPLGWAAPGSAVAPPFVPQPYGQAPSDFYFRPTQTHHEGVAPAPSLPTPPPQPVRLTDSVEADDD